jgi:ribonuclease HI
MTVSWSPELRSSPGLTGLSSLTSPQVSRGGDAGVLVLTPDGEHFKYMVHLNLKATNNMAEYEALIFGLTTALSLGVW